jgi:nicotinate-nucleotide pyrophosphorylase (carboxylating)
MKKLDLEKIDGIIAHSLKEDIGSGDITANAIAGPDDIVDFVICLREEAVICGIPIMLHVFRRLGANLRIQHCAKEGEHLSRGSIVIKARGRARAILTGERTALNYMQRLSGIATVTRRYIEAVKGLPVRILDTRKTLPRFRYVEKYAVRVGGGTNHRFGLYDQVLIKENHLKLEAQRGPGFIRRAVEKARRKNPGIGVEIEAETLSEVRESLDAGADTILLDNMTVGQVRKAMKIIKGKVKVEVSGGVTLRKVRSYARTGVDFISIGALTHSVKAIDMTLEVL